VCVAVVNIDFGWEIESLCVCVGAVVSFFFA